MHVTVEIDKQGIEKIKIQHIILMTNVVQFRPVFVQIIKNEQKQAKIALSIAPYLLQLTPYNS